MSVYKFDSFVKASNMIDIDCIEYGLFCGDDWNYKDLKAPFTRLYVILEGEGVIEYHKRCMKLKAGLAYIIPSNMNFNCYTPKYMKKLYVHFKCMQWSRINVFDQVHDIPSCEIKTSVFEPFIEVLEQECLADYWRVKGTMMQLIYEFVSLRSSEVLKVTDENSSQELSDLYARLKQGFSAKTRTSDIARELKISPSELSRLYKSATGVTLKYYLQQQLMEEAQVLLLTTNKSIKEIAAHLQYEDALYFTRVFRKCVGEAPTAYREKNCLSGV